MQKTGKLKYLSPNMQLIDIEPHIMTVPASPTAIETIALTSGTSPTFSGFNAEVSW